MGNRESVIYLLLNHITLLRSHSFKGFYDMLLSLYPQIKLILLFILYLYIIVVSLLYTTVLTMLYCIRLDYYTGVAQRKRDGLITRRSQDRNLSPVSYNSVGLQNQLVNASDVITSPSLSGGFEHSGAQKQATISSVWRRGLARRAHYPEVVCSNHTTGILQFVCFTEAGRQC